MLLALALLALLPASALAVSNKGVTGFFGGPSTAANAGTGTTAGQMNTPRGVAVNQANGNVYTVDGTNNRVVEFDSSGNFLRAFGQDVVESGPDQANEIQAITVAAASGSFTLTFGGKTTGATGTGNTDSATKVITGVTTTTGTFVVGEAISGTNIPADAVISAVNTGAGTITFTSATNATGTGPVSNLTANLSATASAAAVQSALNALSTIGGLTPTPGSVAVSGGPGNAGGTAPYLVAFSGGPLAHTNVAQTTAANVSLAGGNPTTSVAASTAREGATGFEICSPPASGDTCKAGTTGGLGGAMNAPQGIAINQITGDVYITDQGNLRVQQFDSNGNFLRAFGQDVVATGSPDNSVATNAVQTLTVTATGGKYTLKFQGKETGEIEAGAGKAAAIQSALQGLTSIGAGNAVVAETASAVYKITFAGALANNFEPAIEVISGPVEVLTGGTAALVNTTVGATGFEVCVAANGDVCKVGASASTGGAFKSTFSGYPAVAPAGAANEGDVLVADPANMRVQEFGPEGAFKRAFGLNVVSAGPDNNGTTNFEVCSAPAGDACIIGTAGTAAGAFAAGTPTRVAEGATGTLYTVEQTNTATNARRVQSFTMPAPASVAIGASGAFDAADLSSEADASAPTDIAIDPTSGDLLVTKKFLATATPSCPITGSASLAESRVIEVESSGSPALTVTGTGALTSGSPIATAVTGSFTVGQAITGAGIEAGTRINAVGSGTLTLSKNATGSGTGVSLSSNVMHGTCAGLIPANGLAMRQSSSTGDVYVTSTATASRIYVLNAGQPTAPAVGIGGVSGIAAHSATVNGFVNPGGPASVPYGLHTTYHFAFKRSTDGSFTNTPEVDAGHGAANFVVSQTFPALEAGTTYEMQIVATKPFGSGTASSAVFAFTTPAAAPEVGIPTTTSALTETAARAALYGSVNPNGQATTYRFEYGTDTNYGTSVPMPDGSVVAGPNAVPVSQYVNGLAPSTTYHFRLVAANATGGTASPDQTFTTPPLAASPGSCPNEAIREAQNALSLPDCRAFEQVSPAEKRPAGTVSLLAPNQITFQAATDGTSVYYPILNGLADATASGADFYLAGRGASEWQSTQVTAPSLVPFPGSISQTDNGTSHIRYNSADLSCTVLESYEPLTEDTPAADVQQGVVNLYRRNSNGSHTLLSNAIPLNPTASAQEPYVVSWASSDCNHILFESKYRLLLNAPISTYDLYEWANGTLRLAGIRPDGSVPTVAQAGNLTSTGTSVNSISSDGSRVFFSAASDAGGDNGKTAVFVRKNASTTVDVSQSKTATPNDNSLGSLFQGALPNGSHVYFTGRYGLTQASSSVSECKATGEGCDLYDYNVNTETLIDLSVDPNPADNKGAGVLGMVDVSEDGSYVYFVARGQLVAGKGQTEAQNVTGAEYSLYLAHNGQFSYVGPIKSSDTGNATGGTDIAGRFENWAADATPDGRHLLFVSSANVSGYPNGVATEAYLYSAGADAVVCASCRPDGLTATGKLGQPPILVKRASGWGSLGRKDPHRPRGISDDGSRIFFSSPDGLTPGADVSGKGNGNGNVYEWDNGRIRLLAPEGTSPVRYADSSASGDDVFFTTPIALAGQDFDKTYDLYDARVDGGFPPPPPLPPACDVAISECQGTASPQPGATGSVSEGFAGSGNPPATLPGCPKGKVRKNGKCATKKSHHRKSHKHHAKRASHNRGGQK